MTPQEEIRIYWCKRRPELASERAKQQGKGKGKQDPSPWAQWIDLERAMSDIETLLTEHVTEIDRLKDEHARALQKVVRGM